MGRSEAKAGSMRTPALSQLHLLCPVLLRICTHLQWLCVQHQHQNMNSSQPALSSITTCQAVAACLKTHKTQNTFSSIGWHRTEASIAAERTRLWCQMHPNTMAGTADACFCGCPSIGADNILSSHIDRRFTRVLLTLKRELIPAW